MLIKILFYFKKKNLTLKNRLKEKKRHFMKINLKIIKKIGKIIREIYLSHPNHL